MHISITKYAFPFHHTRISVPHFVGVYVYAGTINRTPTAANRLPNRGEFSANMGRTVYNNATPTHKNHLFAPQKPTSRTLKTPFSHYKNLLFAPQKPICDKLGGSQKRFVKIIIVAETNISHT